MHPRPDPAIQRPPFTLHFPSLVLHTQGVELAAPVFSGRGEAASQVTPGVMERGGRPERLVCVETVTGRSQVAAAQPVGTA